MKMIRRRWIKGLTKLGVLFHIEAVDLHEPLSLGHKTTLKVALESGLRGGPDKEGEAQIEMDRGHKEANGLQHVPA
ncbi:hypothetical protein TIFTF001_054491 [Ficus carica]|uniref:Uncharacterized protein n=1 Tax=Ficus carica TaxID=3494 RepID=A0AA88EHA0_FICCA|nr:hypothetical protein TIFTF001_054488 [Ficus carica]GMN74954.1 hypothetical protein TIFTF001_054489 [Ficus carica]GMN74957.1 hypothetical protein TIFTF001_054490 [Ficus carica]GMN74959.1 hypothetical protein TIFTF001_054491 [Ficus carica]